MNTWGKEMDIKCENNKVYGYIFRVASRHDKLLRSNPKVVILTVQKLAGVLFTTRGQGY